MTQMLGYISGIIAAICYVPYIYDVIKGKTRPERASWLIWALLGTIAYFSQLSKGATDSLWLVGVGTIGVIIVFILSLKYGVGGLTKRDVVSIIIAILGVVMWFFTKEPTYALIITIFVDLIGVSLTLIKTYEYPSSETIITWIMSSLSGLIAAFAVGSFNLILLVYPLYIFMANLAVAMVMVISPKNK